MTEQNPETDQKKWIAPSVILSGICWYLSCGLNGDSWYLLWIAPVPILILSLNVTGKKAFIFSFLAYLIGRMSWFTYLVTVATIIPAMAFTLLLPLIFALIVTGTRWIVLETRFATGVFAFPLFFTAYEFLFMRFSADGTAGSIAYSQSDCLPLIQIASVTGILGITFIVTLIPSILAVGWYHRERKKFGLSLLIALILVLSFSVYGIVRFKNHDEIKTIKAGLVVLDEKQHHVTDQPDPTTELAVVKLYTDKVSSLAKQGAQLVVLPERAFNVNAANEDSVMQMLETTAKQYHVYIISGYTNFTKKPDRNSSLVVDTGGKVVCNYNKVHLVTGFERQFKPGNEIGLFKIDDIQAGTAICKDLDFPAHLRKYGENKVSILCIPAWDFVQDDWLHSRMAILRGVENGFSEVRSARNGRLTISDCFGRVNCEISSAHQKGVMLIGEVSLRHINTIYSRFGDWFGIAVLIAAIGIATKNLLWRYW